MILMPVSCPIAMCSGKRPTNALDALTELAKRLAPFPEGDFSPSKPPAILYEITDDTLDKVCIAVHLVAAQNQLGVNATSRLMAWVVADARGATLVLSKADALKVGKKLERQAAKVHGDRQALLSAPQIARCRRQACRRSN